MVHVTARGVSEPHESQGFAFGDLNGVFGPWVPAYSCSIGCFDPGICLVLLLCCRG